MTDRTRDGAIPPTTPIYDETIEATAVRVAPYSETEPTTGDRAKQQARDTAGQAKDTAKETAGVAKEQAGQVAGTAKDAGARVAGTTKDQASRVASDAVGQAKQLYGQATDQLSEQAGKQQTAAAGALRTLSGDLQSLQRGEGGGDGLAAELVEAISTRANRLGEWLEQREPADVLHDVRQFAARRPGLFIALAAVTGVVAARATKALTADAKQDGAPTRRTADRSFDGAPDAETYFVAPEDVAHDSSAVRGEYSAGTGYGTSAGHSSGTVDGGMR